MSSSNEDLEKSIKLNFTKYIKELVEKYEEIKDFISGKTNKDVIKALEANEILHPLNKLLTDHIISFKRGLNGIGESLKDTEEKTNFQNGLFYLVVEFNDKKNKLKEELYKNDMTPEFKTQLLNVLKEETKKHTWLGDGIIKENEKIFKGGRKTRKQRKHRRKSNKKKSRKSRK